MVLVGCTSSDTTTTPSTTTDVTTTTESTDTSDTTTTTENQRPGGPGGQPPGMSNTNAEGFTTGQGGASTTVTDRYECGITPQTTEGPYYVTGTAELVDGDLNYDNLAGDPIQISGYVYAGADGTDPIANAKIEIWHADNTGSYHPNNNGAASSYSSSELSLRGYIMTDEDGYYEFTSIYPGEYSGRTRHLHFRVTADGYQGVITQLIATKPTDSLSATTDSIAASLPYCHQIQDELIDSGEATFDFRLDTAA